MYSSCWLSRMAHGGRFLKERNEQFSKEKIETNKVHFFSGYDSKESHTLNMYYCLEITRCILSRASAHSLAESLPAATLSIACLTSASTG